MMKSITPRVRRITVVAAGVAVLGGVLTGTALADDSDDTESSGYPNCDPVYAEGNYGMPTYNGERDDDRAYDSDDYEPDCTGFHGRSKHNGYNGYNGTDQSRYDDDNFILKPF